MELPLAKLTLLSSPAPIDRHVVFIHGVRLSNATVWLSSDKHPEVWPLWLADDIPGLGVWSIDHDSAPTLWRGHAMPVVDRANNILPLLLGEERLAHGDIAFVAHSLGGLILEELLRVANDRSTGEPGVADFVRRVSRITFLGTPHRGADLATWAGILRMLVRPSSAAKGLARNDPNLRGLNSWFRRYAVDNGIAIQTLTETRRTFLFLVVAPDSADPGLPSDPIPLDADHFGIASPTSRVSEAYVHIRTFLKTPLPPRGRRRLVDDDVLQGIATVTTANAGALDRIQETLSANAPSSESPAGMPRELVDAEADRRLAHLRKSRFFNGARPAEQASRLATDLLDGDLALTSPTAKARGLAWCARLLLGRPDRAEAQELVRAARHLADTEEVSIAEALEQSYAGNLESALNTLSRLDSPAARSASFIAIKNSKGPNDALDWLRKAGLTVADIDSDGQFFVISTQLDANRLEDALASCAPLGPSACDQTPALWYIAAITYLASVIPRELTESVLSQPPFAIGSVPLADDLASVERRRKARHLFQQAAVAAAAFECLDASYDAIDRALLLGLRDPNERDNAIADLEQSMRSSEHSLRRLPIALQFGLKLDLEAVDKEIDRQMTLSAGGSRDAALARFAVSRTKSARESAEYIQKHRHELAKHLNPSFLAGLEIASLVESGQFQLAEERVEQVLGRDQPPEERERLLRIIAEARESDPTAFRERRFAATDALPDLALLVEALERNRDWTRLARYAAILFRRTRDAPSCRRYARSLFEIADFRGVVEFVRSQEDLLSRSEQLQSLLAWSLYNLGDVNGCRDVLAQLRTRRDTPEDRALTVTLAITSGDWNSLAKFVEREWERRSDRSAEELLRAGQIAHQLASARARALIGEAAARAADDPHVLLGCYSSSMAAGWEDEETFRWLERSATLSDADGPVQRVSLKDLLDRRPDWQRRETQAWEQLNAGLIPIVACARMLNRSLIELSLLPALANLDTIDPRRRTLLYSYSGARNRSSTTPQSVAIDPTALLTAGMLGLLDRMVSGVSKVVIPHSTLGWLFEEKQRIGSHQPSRVADAREIKRLVDAGVLQRLEPTAPSDEDFAREVGQELASLFAEAEADWGDDRRPRRVVRSRPIHRAGSLMEEEADLGSHAAYVCGCLDVIDALARQGRVTRVEEQRARTFLRLHETPWTGTSGIAPGSVLYMDGVSLSQLQHLRLLSKFRASGFTVMIASSEVVEGDRRIGYEALADRATAIIDHIREVLSHGIASGKVILAPRSRNDDSDDRALDHPALDIIRVAALADAAIIDDRYLNQHASVSHDRGETTPIVTTFDLLSALQPAQDEHAHYVSRMRSAGIAFVPLSSDELGVLLSRAPIADDRLVETAELKALRENLQLCRMSNGLQLPKESVWFDGVVRALIETIKAQWCEGIGRAAARARSTWLLQQLEVRGWSHRYVNDQNRGISELRFRAQLMALVTFRVEAPMAIRRAYWEWVDDALLDSVRDLRSDLYRAFVQDVSGVIKRTAALQQAGNVDVD